MELAVADIHFTPA